MRLGSYSYPSLSTQNGRIFEAAKKELLFPHASKVYKQMSLDPNIAAARTLIDSMLTRGQWSIKVDEDAPQEEKDRCEQLNFNLMTMDRPWDEYLVEFMTYIDYGFNPCEKLYQKMETPLGNFIGWKDFRTISQETVEDWVLNTKTGDLDGLIQDLSLIIHDSETYENGTNKRGSKAEVSAKKFMLFRNRAVRNNPQGRSSFDGCYLDWKYRGVVSEYQTIGVTKDTAGTIYLGVDAGYRAKALANPSGPEAANIAEMERQAASFTANDQAFVSMPIAYDDKGKPLFEFKILGVEGGGKNFDTVQIIKEHDKKILMTFLADVLALGKDGSGSFAMSDNLVTLLTIGIEYHLKNIANTLNHDLIRQTYELNEWEYDPRTACKFVYEKLDDGDISMFASAVQKVMAVGGARMTQDIEDKVRDVVFDLPPFENAETELIETEDTSRSGDGLTSGMPDGVGDSTSSGGDRSVGNSSQETS
jgi:hypothetical protein